MKKVCICWLMVVVLSLFAAPSFADTVDVTFVGPVTGAMSDMSNSGYYYYISPYSLLVNGTVENGYCIDFNHEITSGQSWTANTTPASGPFGNTYLNSQIPYQEMGWLVSQFGLASSADQKAIQQAIWDISTQGTFPFLLTGQTQVWYNLATTYSNYNSWTGAGWTILTDANNKTASGAQEFLIQGPVPTPEPGTIMLLGSGILGVYGFSRKKRTLLKA